MTSLHQVVILFIVNDSGLHQVLILFIDFNHSAIRQVLILFIDARTATSFSAMLSSFVQGSPEPVVLNL